MRLQRILAASFVAALALLPGCTSSPTIAKGQSDLPVGGFAEVNLLLEAGETVRWEWQATQPMHFNIHAHQGEGVIELLAKDGLSDDASFTADEAGGYSLMWVNNGAAAGQLSYFIGGSGTLDPAHTAA